VNLSESVNIMLTPQFYTLKREEIPVKYAYQAKKIAPSLFEGLLEDGGEYEYSVFKEEDTWAFVAYDINKITTFLASKGIEASKISKLYFAQESLNSFSTPLSLNDNEALVTLNDTVVVVPKMALAQEEENFGTFSNSFTPAKGGVGVKGGSSSSLFTQQQAFSLAAILMLFAGIFVVEGMRYGGGENNEEEMQALYAEYPSLESSYTRQGIIDKYRIIDKKERKKRDIIKDLSSMIFKGVTLTSVIVNDKKFEAKFTCTTSNTAKRVQDLAKKAHFKIVKNKQSNNLTIEGVL